MKFKTGDLVKFKPSSTIYGIVVNTLNLGIIVEEAILMYVHDWQPDGDTREYWAYDVLMGNHTFNNVPEEVLEKIENDDEENS